ncbi:hypothetical protein C0J52_16159 [Blattella germanica]|nr:hypothetical protein C0J52_16159 [Blattella germanica]
MDKQQTYSLHIIDGNELEVTHQTKKRKHEENNNTDGYKQEVKSRKYFCSACENFFKYKSQYEKHKCLPINIPESDEPLQEINKDSTTRKTNIGSHENEKLGSKINSERMLESGEKEFEIEETAIRTEKPKKIQKCVCSICQQTFKSYYQYKKHKFNCINTDNIGGLDGNVLKEPSGITNEETKIGKHLCSKCQQNFKFKYEFKKHQNICKSTEQLSMNGPKKTTVTINEKVKIVNQYCSKCQQNFKFKYQFKKHQKSCNITDNTEEPKKTTVIINDKAKNGKHFCSKCQQNFKFKYEFKKHQNNCKTTDNTEDHNEKETKKTKLTNDQTTKLLTNEQTKIGKHVCSKCQQSFKFKYEFKKHNMNCKTIDDTQHNMNDENSGIGNQIVEDYDSVLANQHAADTEHKEYKICFRCIKIFQNGKHICIPMNFSDKDIYNFKNQQNVLRKGTANNFHNFFCKDCHKYFQYWYQFKIHSCQRVFVEEEELEEEETEVYEMDKNSKEYKRFKNKRWKPNILEVYDHSSGAMKTVYHCKICDLFFEAYKNFNFHSDFHFLC